MLISNCEPILNEIVSKFDNFNKINKISGAFEHQVNNSYSDESENDIQIKKKALPSKNKLKKSAGQKESQF